MLSLKKGGGGREGAAARHLFRRFDWFKFSTSEFHDFSLQDDGRKIFFYYFLAWTYAILATFRGSNFELNDLNKVSNFS